MVIERMNVCTKARGDSQWICNSGI